MKKLVLLLMALVLIAPGFAQTITKSKINPYQRLDQVLSPFEDMTEYALGYNTSGVTEALNRINKVDKELIFKYNLTDYHTFSQKLVSLKKAVASHNYKKVVLESAALFKFNMTHFIYASHLTRQLHLEHMDYMGYQVLALLKQDNVDWNAVSNAAAIGQQNWLILRTQVKDYNLKDSFNQLFKGMQLSIKQKNAGMATILGKLDLSLVDVLESSFK